MKPIKVKYNEEKNVYDVFVGKKIVKTFEKFDEAVDFSLELLPDEGELDYEVEYVI